MNIEETTTPKKPTEPMKEDLFWLIIEESLEHSITEKEQLEYLVNRLKTLKSENIVQFKLRLELLITVLFNTHVYFHSLAYDYQVAHREFSYRCYWFVARGEAKYHEYLADSKLAFGPLTDCNYKFKSLIVAPNQAFKLKTGKNINDFLDGELQIGYAPEEDDDYKA